LLLLADQLRNFKSKQIIRLVRLEGENHALSIW
jgi:hypothetical protein